MKKMLISFCLLLPLVTIAADKPVKTAKVVAPQAEEELDRVVAIVNEEIITETMLNNHMDEVYGQLMRTHRKLPAEDVLRKSVLDQLINKTLQLQIAKNNNITVEDEEVDAGIQRLLKQNHMELPQLKASLKHEGLTIPKFRVQIRESLLIHKIQDTAVRNKILITDAEVDDMMKKQSSQLAGQQVYHLSHILIPLPEEPTSKQLQQAKMHAQQLYRKILNGADFSKIASENSSTDTLEGGDLGWRKFAELPSIFTDQLKHMKTNDVAGPIQAPNGYHIIKLLGMKTTGKQITRQDIKNLLYQRKMMDKVQEWMTKIRGTSYIKITS